MYQTLCRERFEVWHQWGRFDNETDRDHFPQWCDKKGESAFMLWDTWLQKDLCRTECKRFIAFSLVLYFYVVGHFTERQEKRTSDGAVLTDCLQCRTCWRSAGILMGNVFSFQLWSLNSFLFLLFFPLSQDCHTFWVVAYNENITPIDLCWFIFFLVDLPPFFTSLCFVYSTICSLRNQVAFSIVIKLKWKDGLTFNHLFRRALQSE